MAEQKTQIHDSLKTHKTLTKTGYSNKQADGFVEAIDNMEFDHLVTKTYMAKCFAEFETKILKYMIAQIAIIVSLIKLL